MTTLHGRQVELSQDKAEARQMPHRLLAEGRPRNGRSGVTLRRLCDLFLERTRDQKGEGTYRYQVQHLSQLCSKLGTRDPAALRVHDIETWLAARQRWKPPTKGLFVTVVKAVFNWGRAQGYLESNPLKELRRRSTGRRERVLTVGEWERIEGAVSAGFRDFLTVLWLTGCRPYIEAARMTAADIDFESGQRVVEKHKNRRRTGKPRYIYLPPALLARVRELAAEHPTGPLLRNGYGNPWRGDTANAHFRRACKRLEIGGAVPYSLRTTYITKALANGVPVGVVAALCGNTPQVIHSNYNSVDRMDDVLRMAAQRAVS